MNLLEELLEALDLNENIPRDLVKAYKRITRNGGSMEYERTGNRPNASHSAMLSADTRRRFMDIDYGKCSYEELTPEEAIEYVKQDINNIENLRMLYHGNLVEFENRNGKLYATTRDSNDRVDTTITLNGVQKNISARNIGYLTNPKVIFHVVDKIYKTDEYDHYLSPEFKDKRAQRIENSVHAIGSLDVQDPNYHGDPHDYSGKFYHNTKVGIDMNDFDTGSHGRNHSVDDYDFPEKSKYIIHTDPQEDDYNSISDFKNLFDDLARQKRDAYHTYDMCRHAERAFINRHTGYSEQEYNDRLQELEAQTKNAYNTYKTYADEAQRIKDRSIRKVDAESLQFNKKLQTAFSDLTSFGNEYFRYKEMFKKRLSSDIANSSIDYNKRLDWEIADMESILRKLSAESEAERQDLENADVSGEDLVKIEASINRRNQELNDNVTARIKTLNDEFEQLIDRIDSYRDSAENAEEIIHPKTIQKRRAARAAQEKEMDPELASLLDFGEEENSQED